MSDALAVYGSVIATLVGFVQIAQWRASKQFLSVNYLETFGETGSTIEVAIANRGPFSVHLDFVAGGTSCVHWRKPWERDCDSLRSLSAIKNHREETEILEDSVDGMKLRPGEMVYAAMRKENFPNLQSVGNPQSGFLYRHCIWIEHSQSDHPICKVIEWAK